MSERVNAAITIMGLEQTIADLLREREEDRAAIRQIPGYLGNPRSWELWREKHAAAIQRAQAAGEGEGKG